MFLFTTIMTFSYTSFLSFPFGYLALTSFLLPLSLSPSYLYHLPFTTFPSFYHLLFNIFLLPSSIDHHTFTTFFVPPPFINFLSPTPRFHIPYNAFDLPPSLCHLYRSDTLSLVLCHSFPTFYFAAQKQYC